MNQREKILAIAVSSLLGYLALQGYVKEKIFGPLRDMDQQIVSLMEGVQAKQNAILLARVDENELNSWKELSLPADTSTAAGLYEARLRELLKKAGIERPTVLPPQNNETGGEGFSKLTFTVKFQSELGKFSRFLYELRKDPILHLVKRIHIGPPTSDQHKDFDFDIRIEAASLADAVAKDKLPEPKDADRRNVAQSKLDVDKFSLFADKNLFQATDIVSARALPVRRGRPSDSRADERADVYLTAITIADDKVELWLTNKKTNTRIKVSKGKELSIGGLTATVVEVTPKEVILDVGGKVGAVRFGSNLASWKETPRTVY